MEKNVLNKLSKESGFVMPHMYWMMYYISFVGKYGREPTKKEFEDYTNKNMVGNVGVDETKN